MTKKFWYLNTKLISLLEESEAIYLAAHPQLSDPDWLKKEQYDQKFSVYSSLEEAETINRLALYSVCSELQETYTVSTSSVAQMIFGGEQ